MRRFLIALVLAATLHAERVPGLHARVEIIRDNWGVPHIYAANSDDLFFAQGWITAKDRLFQLDLWRRTGSGKLAEIAGPEAVGRDRIARLLRYRGDWNKEWASYAPDARQIVTAFVGGINAYIKSLKGRTIEFQIAGYDPGLWTAEDVVTRIPALSITHNAATEIDRALQIANFGEAVTEKFSPPDPFLHLTIPPGLDIKAITKEIVRDFTAAAGPPRIETGHGSNNWVIDGTLSATGKPLLANDPHRDIMVPSLRKIVHLVAPGWNAIGAGEPALPGIALGHNENIAFGFTIVGIDQQDFYVEKINPANSAQYMYKGAWKAMEIEKQTIAVKGAAPVAAELRYTLHGPVLYEDRARHLAYALKTVGGEPGGAAYLAALSVARAKNWNEFVGAMGRYKSPSENMVYADTAGNIGWIASGAAPVRANNASGLLPVPGETGQNEWTGFLPVNEMPQVYNPARHFVNTANNKILPAGYAKQLSYEWSPAYRAERAAQMLSEPNKKFSIVDFEHMQYDLVCLPAKRLQAIVRKSRPARHGEVVDEFLKWDARLTADSRPGLVYELWLSALISEVYPRDWNGGVRLEVVLKVLEERPNPRALADALDRALAAIERGLPHREDWKWSAAHSLMMRHPLDYPKFNLPRVPRPGDSNTVDAAGGTSGEGGASYRQILDVADWDRSVVTNSPGESGDPQSKHYRDLLDDWVNGRYHPLPYSRKAVEAAAEERITLEP